MTETPPERQTVLLLTAMGRQSGDRLSSYISVHEKESPPTRLGRRQPGREPTLTRGDRERTCSGELQPRNEEGWMSLNTEPSSPGPGKRRRLHPLHMLPAPKQANIDRQTIDILRASVTSLQNELLQAKEVVENERLVMRALRRERHADIKAAREEETKKFECLLAEIKNRSEHEKNVAVASKADQLERKFQTDFSKFSKMKELEMKKMRTEEKRTREELTQQFQETQRASKARSPRMSLKGSLDKFHHKDFVDGLGHQQNHPPDRAAHAADKHDDELSVLKAHKAMLESTIQVAHESDRKLEEIRKAKERVEVEIKEAKKRAKTVIIKLMNETRSKDRVIVELESQVKKLAETEQRKLLREEVARDRRLTAETRRAAAKIGLLQDKLSHVQESAAVREQNLGQEIRRGREEKVREVNFFHQEARSKEEEQNLKMTKLTEEYNKLKTNMVQRLSEAEQSIAPLKSKNRQFVSRNLELSARNKQLQDTLRELTVKNNKEKEEEQDIDPDGRSLQSTKIRNKEESRRSKSVDKQPFQTLEIGEYQNLYTHLQREYTELQRAYQLLQTRIKHSGQDVEREEKNRISLKNKLNAAETKIIDLESSLKQNDPSASTKKLIDEKQTFINQNLGLSEKIRVIEDREERLRSDLQDSKDQSELLEFRVLELEECQEKAQTTSRTDMKETVDTSMTDMKETVDTSMTDMKETVDTGTETDTQLTDSGCSSLHHSRCPSVATDDDIAEIRTDFRNEKIHETQEKLHALVGYVQGSTSKSLLLQTVALFEALLARIKELQQENQNLKQICGINNIEEEDKSPNAGANDDHNLEIEKLNQDKIGLVQELKEAQTLIQSYKEKHKKLTEDWNVRETDLEKKDEVQRKVSDMQNIVEDDLKKQINCLNKKLDTTIVGCRSESEMYGESLLKVSILERSILGLKQCIDDLQSEKNELREQLSAAMEHHMTNSSVSLGTEFETAKESSLSSDISKSGTQKSSSSGIGSDLSDSESEPFSLHYRSLSVETDLRQDISYLQKKLEETRYKLNQATDDKCEIAEAENDSRLRTQVSEKEAHDFQNNFKDLEDKLLFDNKHSETEFKIKKEKEDSSDNEIACLELISKGYKDKIAKLEQSNEWLVNGLNLLLKGVTIWSYIHHNKYGIVKKLDRGLCFRHDNLMNLHHSDGLFKKIRRSTSLSTVDEPLSKKMRISCDDELNREKEELKLDVLKLNIEKEQQNKAYQKTFEENIERIMSLENKVSELFDEGNLMRDQFQKEITETKALHEKELNKIVSKENVKFDHFNYLQNIVDNIENELENVNVNGESDSLKKLKLLLKSESELKNQIYEHEKKEYAFRETLAEADVIMTNIEHNYNTKVKDLEEENSYLKQRITYHTETEQRLKETLKKTEKYESHNYVEHLERLMESEKAELGLKEMVFYLEKNERELSLKYQEEQKKTSNLKNEMKDQEDLMAQMESILSDNKQLIQDSNRLKAIEFKYQEIQQSEKFLHGRVEELEQTEIALQEALSVLEQTSAVKEKKLQDHICRLIEDVQQQNHSASSYEDAFDRMRGQDGSLRMEIDYLNEKITELTCELDQKSTNFQENEASLRIELHKARQHLSQTNNQLTELDTINSLLSSNLSQAEQQVNEKNGQLDQLKHQLEETNIQHSVQIQAKDNFLQNIQDKSERLRRKSHEKELKEITQNEGGLLAVTKEVEDAALAVSDCISCSPILTSKLKDAAAQLSCLSTLICQGDQSRKMSPLGELHRCESEEVLTSQIDEFESTFEVDISGNPELSELEENMLESQLSELQEKLGRMEAEMTIVSEESKDLQDNLGYREADLVEKSQQLLDLTELVEHLTHNTEQEKQRTDKILMQLKCERERLHEKDKYLSVFVERVLPACTIPNKAILAALKETPPDGSLPPCDFTLESLITAIVNRHTSYKKLVSDTEMKKLEGLKNTSCNFRERSPISKHKINLTLLPPELLRITRQVGSDGLLVAWHPPDDDEVTGYLIYVGGCLVQRVRSANRTKALLHGLYLVDSLTIVLHSTNSNDDLSDPAEVVYTKGMVLPDQKKKRRGKVPVNQLEDNII